MDLRRTVVRVKPRAVTDPVQLLERDVEPVADRIRAGFDQDVTAPKGCARDAERHRDPLARFRPLDRSVVHVNSANARSKAGRLDAELVASTDGP